MHSALRSRARTHDDPPTASTPHAVALAIKDGNDQSAPAGGLLAQPLRATATDGKGIGVPGAIVKFRVNRGSETGTTVMDTIAVAGFDGTASVELRLGTALDTSIVEASLADQPTVVARFRATATPPPRLDEVVPVVFLRRRYGSHAGPVLQSRGGRQLGVLRFCARAGVVRGDADTSLTVVVPPCVSAGAVTTRVVVGSVATNAIATTFVGSGGLIVAAAARRDHGQRDGARFMPSARRRRRVLPPRAAVGRVERHASGGFRARGGAPTLGTEAMSPLPLIVPTPRPVPRGDAVRSRAA